MGTTAAGVAIAALLLVACAAPGAGSPAKPAGGPGAAAPAAESKPAAAAAPGAGAPGAAVPREVRMAFGFVAPAALPMWIALDQGIYQKHGLDVEPTLMQSSAQIAPAMAAG